MYQNIFYDRTKYVMHVWDDIKGHMEFPYKRYAYKLSPHGRYTTIHGKKVEKVFRFNKDEIEEGIIFESDVRPEVRTLIDMYQNSEEVSTGHKVVILDIEVSSENGFPTAMEAESEVTAISLYDKAADTYHALILDKDSRIKSKKTGNTHLYGFQSEEDLLYGFIGLWMEIEPSIVSTWNGDMFDIPYIYNRLKNVLGIKIAAMLSPVGSVEFDEFSKRYKIGGVSQLDYLPLFKKYSYSEHPSYQLDAICKKELGHGKIQYEGSLDRLFREDLNKFIEYNINDVVLVKELDDKFKYIDLVMTLCHKCHVAYEDIFLQSRCLEGALLTYMRQFNIVANNKKQNAVSSISGAYVKDPKESGMLGRHDWVYDLDFSSLYPSVIMSLNISPETKVCKVRNWNSEEYVNLTEKTYELKFERSREIKKLSTEEFKNFITENEYAISANGVVYNIREKGLIPSLLETWFAERVEFRKLAKKYGNEGKKDLYEFYDKRQLVQKILLNSMYGVLGASTFRFFDPDNAEAVTTTGVQILKYSQKVGNQYFQQKLKTPKSSDYCIYSDTDSCYFSAMTLLKAAHPKLDWTDNADIIRCVRPIVDATQKYINDSFNSYCQRYHNITEHKFVMKQELIAKSMFLVAKKRYALWILDNNGVAVDELSVKGIDVVRSNFAAIFREFMGNVLKKILDSVSKKELDLYITDFKKRLVTFDLKDIGKPTSVKEISKFTVSDLKFKKGTPAHVKAALAYNFVLRYLKLDKKYSPITDSSKIKWFYLKPNKFNIPTIAIRGYDDPPELLEFVKQHIDYDQIFESDVEKKLEKFYTALNWLRVTYNVNVDKFFVIE